MDLSLMHLAMAQIVWAFSPSLPSLPMRRAASSCRRIAHVCGTASSRALVMRAVGGSSDAGDPYRLDDLGLPSSVKNELSPNTICSSSRWSVSLQNCSQTSRSSVQNAYRQEMQWQQAPCPSDKCIMNCQHLGEFSCRFALRRNNAQIQTWTEKGKASASGELVTKGLYKLLAGALASFSFRRNQ